MSVRHTIAKQYQAIVNGAAASVGRVRSVPPEGWIVTVRKALGMTGLQLAERVGVKKSRIHQAEHSELSGSPSLKTMQAAAEAMGCRFVYAIVPVEGRIENVIAAQAHKKASALVAKASDQMSLENQALSEEKIRAEVKRLAAELAFAMPPDFWNDK